MAEPSAAVETVVETETVIAESPSDSRAAAEATVNIEDLVAANQRLQAKNEQVLGEKKKAQAKLRENEDKFQAIYNGLSQLMGIEDEVADPKVLAQQVASLQDQISAGEVERKAITATYRRGLDPDIAVPVLRSQGKLNIDLADAEFDSVLEAAVEGLAAAYPNLVSGGVRETSKPKAVAPTPSAATPAGNLAQEWERVLAGGQGDEISRFARTNPKVVEDYYRRSSGGGRQVLIG